MSHQELTRPVGVWIISLVLALSAAVNIAILSFSALSPNPDVRNVASQISAIDWVTLYGLSAIMLVSMVLFFRLRKRAVSWFAVYIGVSSWVAWGYALASDGPPYFDELVSLAGFVVALGVLGYMLRLRKRQVLM